MQNSLYFVHMRNMDGQAGFADITIQACLMVGIMLLNFNLVSLCWGGADGFLEIHDFVSKILFFGGGLRTQKRVFWRDLA